MKLPFRRKTERPCSPGQALVEFALVLPLIAVLLVFAIDFGRVFYGWVALNNAARVGANYAATHADAWTSPTNAAKDAERAAFIQQIVNDGSSVNCSPKPAPGNITPPTFTLADGATPVVGTPQLGNQAMVTLSCSMGLLTPLAGAFFPGGVSLRASATFTVRSGAIGGLPVGGSVPTPSASPTPSPSPSPSASASGSASATASPTPQPTPCPLPIANFAATPTRGDNPLTVQFTDTSQTFGCAVSGWTWDFGDGYTSTLRDPSHKFTGKGTYAVSLTVTSPGGTDSELQNGYITVE